MPARRIRVDPAMAMRSGFEAIRDEAGVPDAFPPEVEAEAAVAARAAIMHEATGVGRGAGYTAFDGEPPAEAEHFAIAAPYAHATAPLRRLQDRFVSECCLAARAGTPVPDWVHAGLAALPDALAAGSRR